MIISTVIQSFSCTEAKSGVKILSGKGAILDFDQVKFSPNHCLPLKAEKSGSCIRKSHSQPSDWRNYDLDKPALRF